MTATLYIAAAILATLALIGTAWLAGHWAKGRVRKAYRDAGVPWDDPELPEWACQDRVEA